MKEIGILRTKYVNVAQYMSISIPSTSALQWFVKTFSSTARDCHHPVRH